MRKSYYILIVSLAAAAGCARTMPVDGERVGEDTPPRETISFSAHADSLSDVATRAMEFGYWQAGMQLKVYSWETNTTRHFRDFLLTYNAPYTTSWSYDDPVEQPEVSISYYAWRPAEGGATNFVADGFTGGFDYTVPVQTEDLTVSKSVTSTARVPMFFFHPLSEINFAVQGIEGYHVNVTDISVNNVKNSGHLTIETWNGGTWTNVGGDANYTYTPDYGTPHDNYVPRPLPTSGTDNDVIYLGNLGGWGPRDNDRQNALMLMPQSFDTPGAGGHVTFLYTITNMDGSAYKSGFARANFADFSDHTWVKSRRYVYVIDCRGVIEDARTRGASAGEDVGTKTDTEGIEVTMRTYNR